MKYSCKFQKKRIIQKKYGFSSFLCYFGGGDEIRSLSMVKSDEIKPLQTVTSSTLVCKVKISNEFKWRPYPVGLHHSQIIVTGIACC
jgi:hypothetical protein